MRFYYNKIENNISFLKKVFSATYDRFYQDELDLNLFTVTNLSRGTSKIVSDRNLDEIDRLRRVHFSFSF